MSQPWWGRVQGVVLSYWTPAGKQALGNLIGLLMGIGVGNLCAFGSLLILTESLGADVFGRLSVALTVQMYLWTFAGLGLGGVLLRELGRNLADADRLRATFLILQLLAAALFAVGQLVVVAFLPLPPDERWLYFWLALGLPSLSLALGTLFDAAHRQAVSGFIGGGCEAAALAVVLWLRNREALSLASLGGVYFGKWLLTTTGQWLAYRVAVGRIGWTFDSAAARVLLASGWPLMLSAVLALVPLTAGLFVVRWQAGEAEAGRYGLAAQFANAVLMVGTLGNRILLPHVHGEYGLTRSFVKRLILFGALFWGGSAAGGALAGAILVTHALPPDYADAVLPLVLLCVAVAFQLAGQVVQGYLVRANRGGVFFGICVVGTVVQIVMMSVGSNSGVGTAVWSLLASAGTLIAAVGAFRFVVHARRIAGGRRSP